MPGWVQEGGIDKWVERLKDPATRARVIAEMRAPADGSPGSVSASGSPGNILILGGTTPGAEALAGRTLGDIAKSRGTSPGDAIIDLVTADHARKSNPLNSSP